MADRIFIYGVTGTGKSTLAARLAGRTGIPWHSVDDLTWEPGWTEVPLDKQRQRISEICAGERWILDAAYPKWRDIPLARAQLIVALDYPRWVSLGRLLWRTLRRLIERNEKTYSKLRSACLRGMGSQVLNESFCNGNTESLRQALSRDSIVAWHFRSFAKTRARIRAWAASPPGAAEVVRLTSPRATDRWLAGQRPAPPGAAPPRA